MKITVKITTKWRNTLVQELPISNSRISTHERNAIGQIISGYAECAGEGEERERRRVFARRVLRGSISRISMKTHARSRAERENPVALDVLMRTCERKYTACSSIELHSAECYFSR